MFPLTEKRNNLRGAAGFQSRSESWEMRCGRFDVCVVSFLLLSPGVRLSLSSEPKPPCVCSGLNTSARLRHKRLRVRTELFRVVKHRFSRHIPGRGRRTETPVAVHLSLFTCRRHDVSGSVMPAERERDPEKTPERSCGE